MPLNVMSVQLNISTQWNIQDGVSSILVDCHSMGLNDS